MAQLTFNLFTLKKRLEMVKGRDIPWSEIAADTRLNRNTIDAIANNKANGIRFETLSKLLDYFRAQGLQVSISDLICEVTEANS